MNLGLKLKAKRKIIILTFILVLALIQIITVSALAGGNQLVITDSAFLNVRSGVVGNRTPDQFTTPSFQNPTAANYHNHFNRIFAGEIENREDSRHRVTLQHQADAIRVNRTINGQYVGPNISNLPMLTVFTYGQGANPSHWSNNGVSDGAGGFLFDFYHNSMIETLRRSTQPEAHVWVASAPIYRTNVDKINEVDQWNQFTVNKGNGNIAGRSYLRLHKLQANSESYRSYQRNNQTHEQFIDFNRHNIIIFETDNSHQYHDYVYNQLAATLIQISYDFLYATGQVPLINMISHSTGGNWNMMFANRFPLNVSALYAIAAPFKGSTFGNHLFRDFGEGESISQHLSNMAVANLRNSVLSPSGMNNVSDVSQARMDALRIGWNNAVSINPNLQLIPITADINLTDLLFSIGYISCLNSLVAYIMSKVIGIAAKYVAAKIVAIIPVVGWITAASIAMYATLELYFLIQQWGGIASHLWDSISIGDGGFLTLHDDGLVSRYSAIPSNEFNSSNYFNNVTQREIKRLSLNNNYRRNVDSPAFPHNIQTMHSDIVSFVDNNINMGVRFNYTQINNNTAIRIDGRRDNNNVDTITIPSEINGLPVTQIGPSAFRDLAVNTVIIPSTLTIIGERAFENSTIQSLTIPENSNLQEIGYAAFRNATNLREIDLPRSFRHIRNSAFEGTTSLTNVNIDGEMLSTIGERSFKNSGLRSFRIPAGLQYIEESAFEGSTNLVVVTIASDANLKTIGNSAFRNTGISEITIPNMTTEIGASAFENTNLSNVFISNHTNLQIIGNRAFRNTNLNEFIIHISIRNIGELAFEGTNIRHFVIPQTVTSIGRNAFSTRGLLSLKWYYNPNLDSFGFRHQLTDVVIHDGVDRISSRSFQGNAILTSFQLPSSILSIDNHAFEGMPNLSNVVFANNSQLLAIENNAFSNNPNLRNFTILSSVIRVGRDAFTGSSNLSITWHYNPNLESHYFNWFVRSIFIPEGMTTISPRAFADSQSLMSVFIPGSVTDIGAWAFAGTSNLVTVEFAHNSQLRSIGNEAFLNSGVRLLGFSSYDPEMRTIFPNTLTEIGVGAFANTRLTNIVIPSNVVSIGAGVFQNTISLRTIQFESNSRITLIGSRTFQGTSLTSINIPDSVTFIGSNAFENARNLSSVEFAPNSLLRIIDYRAFFNTALTNFNIPNGVTDIGVEAFRNTRLVNITIPNGVRHIGFGLFRDTETLRSVQFANNSPITIIPDRTFQGTGLTTINLPDSVTSIGDFAFLNVQSLNSIGLPNGLRRIGNSAFENTDLRNITIPRQVYFIGTWAFAGTLQLTTVDFAPDSVLSGISQGTFQNSRLNNINLPNSLTSIGASAFTGTPNLTGIIIPNRVTNINASAFQWSGLIGVIIPQSVYTLGANAFRDSFNLQTVEVLRPWSSWVAITSAGANFLDNTHPNLVIGVPDTSSLTAYRNAPNWNSHAHRMVSRAVHVCNHVLEPFCNTYHWFICFECGDFFFERHTWHFDWGSNTAICTVCGLVLQNGRSLFLELLDSGFEMPLAILKEFNELEYLSA